MSRVSSLGSSLPGGLAIGLCLLAATRADAAPTFEQEELHSHNGAALLRWTGLGVAFEVQRARERDFSDAQVLYVGSLPSAHVSGLRNGEHYFRVRSVDDHAWSAPTTLTVEHHSMALVWPLFAVGAAVFLTTAAFVTAQVRNHKPGRSA
jgi:hypothetical protein